MCLDSSIGSTSDWYHGGHGFKSRQGRESFPSQFWINCVRSLYRVSTKIALWHMVDKTLSNTNNWNQLPTSCSFLAIRLFWMSRIGREKNLWSLFKGETTYMLQTVFILLILKGFFGGWGWGCVGGGRKSGFKTCVPQVKKRGCVCLIFFFSNLKKILQNSASCSVPFSEINSPYLWQVIEWIWIKIKFKIFCTSKFPEWRRTFWGQLKWRILS